MTAQNSNPARPYANLDAALADPLARPLTLEQVLRRTGRSRRTITSWISRGLITPYTISDGHRTVQVFLERQVLEVHREMNAAAAATRLNLRNQRAKADAARADEPEDDLVDERQADIEDARPANLPMLDVEEPTDAPPNVQGETALDDLKSGGPNSSQTARPRGTHAPRPPLVVKVRGELDTSSLVASLREKAAVLVDAADRLEAVTGAELGAGAVGVRS